MEGDLLGETRLMMMHELPFLDTHFLTPHTTYIHTHRESWSCRRPYRGLPDLKAIANLDPKPTAISFPLQPPFSPGLPPPCPIKNGSTLPPRRQ